MTETYIKPLANTAKEIRDYSDKFWREINSSIVNSLKRGIELLSKEKGLNSSTIGTILQSLISSITVEVKKLSPATLRQAVTVRTHGAKRSTFMGIHATSDDRRELAEAGGVFHSMLTDSTEQAELNLLWNAENNEITVEIEDIQCCKDSLLGNLLKKTKTLTQESIQSKIYYQQGRTL